MTGNPVHDARSEPARCRFPWCTTDHTAVVHPDDDVHRSDGLGFSGRVRGAAAAGPGVLADIEVGVMRRLDDDEPWIVIEAGEGMSLAVTIDAARSLARAFTCDPGIAAVLAG